MSQRRRWRGTVCVALVSLLVLAGCGGESGSPGATDDGEPAVAWRSLSVDGVARRYRLYTPPLVDDAGPMPLVLALHGSENSVESFVDASELDEAASANAFIVAYPEGQRLLWNGGLCCTSGRGNPAEDVRFLAQVVDDVASARRVDRSRVYAVGVSGGGVMAYRLGCDRSDLLAGVAAVSGAMAVDDCKPSGAVSVLTIHGTADGIVPYEGGRIRGGAIAPAPPATAVAERWASLNRCSGSPARQVEGVVTTTTWTGCADDARVRLITLEGGSHNWFSKVYGLPNGAVDATQAIADYFQLGRR